MFRPPEHERPPAEQMLPVDAALARPRAARWLKLLSLRPPVSVTRPTLIVGAVFVDVVELPHAVTNRTATATRPRTRTQRTIFSAPSREVSHSDRAGIPLLPPVRARL